MSHSLSIGSSLSTVREVFKKAPCPASKHAIPIEDCLMSGLALFLLKYPSLLSYDNHREDIADNMHSLFHITKVPCDTYLRERLDEVDAKSLRRCFTKLFANLQRSKYLERFTSFRGKYLMSVDGTGHFSSKTVHCDQCCQKKHKDGTTSYYHQLLQAAIVHPDMKQVVPLAPEAITKQDGVKKNDCERNAAKRLLADFRREHPKLDVIVLLDALYANAPLIKELEKYNIDYIINCKPGDHAWLFDYVEHAPQEKYTTEANDYRHDFMYVNNAPLNESNKHVKVNFLKYTETALSGKRQGTQKTFTWITNFNLTEGVVYEIMRSGRARWRIENEVFNTLKNQGYQFEHNFGHGYKHLSSVFSHLVLLAFLIDQLQELACVVFQNALFAMQRKSYLWKRVLGIFFEFSISSWDSLYEGIYKEKMKTKAKTRVKPDWNDSS